MSRDYLMETRYVDHAQPTILKVCAEDLADAHSECWQKLPDNRHKLVDDFLVLTIESCRHQGGVR